MSTKIRRCILENSVSSCVLEFLPYLLRAVEISLSLLRKLSESDKCIVNVCTARQFFCEETTHISSL